MAFIDLLHNRVEFSSVIISRRQPFAFSDSTAHRVSGCPYDVLVAY